MISVSVLHLIAFSSLLISLITFTVLPLISWCFLIISQLLYTTLHFSSSDLTFYSTSTKNERDANGCTISWKIENINDCWLRQETTIKSPAFTVISLDGTKWSLHLSPAGRNNENVVTGFLKREESLFGPDVIHVKYQIALLDKDGSMLECKPVLQGDFEAENFVFFPIFESQENSSSSDRNSLFPKDPLRIQCKIWNKDEEPIVSEFLSAKTIFKEHRRSFIWRINRFSNFRTSQKKKYMVINKLTYDSIDFKLILNSWHSSEKKLDIDIRALYECINFFSIKVSIMDSDGQRVNCGSHEYLGKDLKKGALFTLFFVKEMFLIEKSKYLPNDVLSLDCEYVFSAVATSYECANCGTSSSLLPQRTVNKKEMCANKEKYQSIPVLLNDLKSMYTDAILCDINLRTSSQTFPAHKAILSVRSSVFRRMFSSDMKEKNSGNVDITDLEDETVQRMLMYMYTDSLEDLQMESASKLYAAADKYDIPSLKLKCSSFLKNNLCPISACNVLVLADMHQDHALKSSVLAYILENDKEVFETTEWKKFMTTNLKLAADVMYLNVSEAKILS